YADHLRTAPLTARRFIVPFGLSAALRADLRCLGLPAFVLALGIGCADTKPGRESQRTASAPPPPTASTAPGKASLPAPVLPDGAGLDHGGNRVDVLLDDALLVVHADAKAADPLRRAKALARLEERVGVEAIFGQPIGTRELDTFEEAGGVVRHVFR